ncbi:MAG: hypothetical protein IT338_08865 [Thermomicrobiales bacterium]|nr:hypothetical protein [Thermomicrobiales bacterium]
MSTPTPGRPGGSVIHFWAIVVVTLLVMVLGVLVVVMPERMGVPQITATPVATPLATSAP